MAVGNHVALLRGINVGGKHKLPMKELVAIFESAGCRDVATYIQSGNVVFRAPAAAARRVPRTVARAIEERFGFAVPVVVRTAAELARVIERNPFLEPKVDPKLLHVGFCATKPKAAKVAKLDPDRSPPDRFHVGGREIYLHCPNGIARTKLTNAYFDKQLETVVTMRNWKTTLVLADMTRR